MVAHVVQKKYLSSDPQQTIDRLKAKFNQNFMSHI